METVCKSVYSYFLTLVLYIYHLANNIWYCSCWLTVIAYLHLNRTEPSLIFLALLVLSYCDKSKCLLGKRPINITLNSKTVLMLNSKPPMLTSYKPWSPPTGIFNSAELTSFLYKPCLINICFLTPFRARQITPLFINIHIWLPLYSSAQLQPEQRSNQPEV